MKRISSFLLFNSTAHYLSTTHFIRVFDNKNQKILKGNLIYVTDSSIVVSTTTNIVELHACKIGLIKTNRSLGHYMLLSALAFSIIGFSMRLMESHPLSQLFFGATIEKAGITAMVAALPGALFGFAIRDAKPPNFIVVNGELNRWKKVNQSLKKWIEK